MSLLDKIKQQMQAPVQQPANLGDQTGTVRKLLQAKTGKAMQPATGPRQSSIKEKLAEQQTQLASKDLQQKGQIQAAQIGEREADIEQRALQQEQNYQQNMRKIQDDFKRNSNSILNQFESGMKRLDNSRDIADLEQLAFASRLSNDKYIDKLQSEGQRMRLDDATEFKKQLTRSIIKDNQALMRNTVAFNTVMDANDREFQRAMAEMDIDYAIQIGDDEIRQAATQQKFEGLGTLVKGASDYYAFDSKKNDSSSDLQASGEKINPTLQGKITTGGRIQN